jgi:hypothetical protein
VPPALHVLATFAALVVAALLVVVLLPVAVGLLVEAVAPGSVDADAELVPLIVDAVALLPVAGGIIGCETVTGSGLGSAVQAAGIADCGRALVAHTATVPLTSRIATSPATRATADFLVMRMGATSSGTGVDGEGAAGCRT